MRILLALFLVAPAWAALSSTVVAEVRATGSNTNGGAFNTAASGTDMSQYDNKNASGCSSCQSASANLSTTDAVTNNTTTVTSATAAFTSAIVGNVIYLSGTGTTTGWYEVTGFTNSTTITVDRATGSTGGTGVTMNIGGAWKLDSDATFLNTMEAGNTLYVKAGTYTITATISITKAASTTNPIKMIGYNATRGDTPRRSGATDNRPLFSLGAFQISAYNATNWDIYNIRAISTNAILWNMQSNGKIINCQFYNTSTTANATAISTGIQAFIRDSEFVSFRGRAVTLGNTSGVLIGNYIHSSNEGLYLAFSNQYTLINNIIEDIVATGINLAAAVSSQTQIIGNTIAGSPTPRTSSKGINLTTGTTAVRIINNIITGWATGVSHADTQSVGVDLANVYYNNTANTNGSGNWPLSSTSTTASNPSFTAHTLINGTAATSSTNVITAGSGTPFTNVVDGADFVWVSSGSGTGFATGIYPISAHTGTTITLAWNGTNFNVTSSGSGSAIAWEIIQGHDFSVGAAIKGLAYPTVWSGLGITNYLDPGAVQRPEGSGSGGTRIY